MHRRPSLRLIANAACAMALLPATSPAQPLGRFTAPAPLAGTSLDGPGLDAFPSLSADERTLVFVSDRPGSLGTPDYGTDIWITVRPEAPHPGAPPGPFAVPTLLGAAVNTDAVFTLQYLFQGTGAPPPPGPSGCEPGTSEAGLGCDDYPLFDCPAK